MTILDKIVVDKRIEVAARKNYISVQELENRALFGRECPSLAQALRFSSTGIIAEFKRRSPSKNEINRISTVEEVVKGYTNAGVCGISILTDSKYFGGTMDDVLEGRRHVNTPILRKEFIVDEFQIIEAKSMGADVILLIASVLTPEEIKRYSTLVKSLGMDVLLEVHDEAELERSIMPTIDMVGVNNRNLKTFDVSLDVSKRLSTLIPNDFVKVSESGISSIEAIKDLKHYDYKGFLIGENFMKTDAPGIACESFIKEL